MKRIIEVICLIIMGLGVMIVINFIAFASLMVIPKGNNALVASLILFTSITFLFGLILIFKFKQIDRGLIAVFGALLNVILWINFTFNGVT